ncbi:hypothetical protein [Actinoplanes sp. NPDC051859]|uniref:hypothetical protein n=1 Tax=Actinoplanes sp. NPDC051859 TaxID=3363909 RepID=UPI0037BE0F07
MSEPYMPHGWLHALVRYSNEPGTDAEDFGAVMDEYEHKVKVRWPDGTTTWEFKRDLLGWGRL